MQEFLYMGGYGGYVWSAFGLTAIVLIWNWVAARRAYAGAIRKLRARQESATGSNS